MNVLAELDDYYGIGFGADALRPPDTDDEPWPVYPSAATGAWITASLLAAPVIFVLALLLVRRALR